MENNESKDYKFVFSAIIVGLIFPIVLALSLHLSNIIIESRLTESEKKLKLLDDFSKSFSQFTSLAADMYYTECIDFANKPEDSECKNNSPDKLAKCMRGKNMKKLLDIQQPESLLSQISVFFESAQVKEDSDLLFEKQKELFSSLDCSMNEEDFNKLFGSIGAPYNNIIRNMAREVKK